MDTASIRMLGDRPEQIANALPETAETDMKMVDLKRKYDISQAAFCFGDLF